MDRALAQPLEFPPLAQAAVPGDKVVLALDRGVPQAATIVARTIAALLSAGVTPQSITLVRAVADADVDAAASACACCRRKFASSSAM